MEEKVCSGYGIMALTRKSLIRLQKKQVKEIKEEIASALGLDNPSMRSYTSEYQREFRTSFQISSEKEVLQKIRKARIVYQGDFHTLPHSQRAPMRILRQLLHRPRKIVLAIEMVPQSKQAVLDSFLEEKIDEKAFQQKTQYAKTWGFDWHSHRDLLNFAKIHRIPVKGLNLPSPSESRDIRERDQKAARIIVQILKDYPKALIYVVFGDLHVSASHLPRQVELLYSKGKPGGKLKKVILYQNSEVLYWKLARQKLEQEATVLKLGREAFCLMNATPLVKYRSFLDWEERRTFGGDVGFGFEEKDPVQEFHQLILLIADFLGIERRPFDDFTLFFSTDLEFLEILSEGYCFSQSRLQEIAQEIRHGQGCFLPEAKIIFLPRSSLNLAAEHAAHFLFYSCGGEKNPPQSPVEKFYRRVYVEAIGFVGSKIVNHKRGARTVEFYRRFIRSYRGKRLSSVGSNIRRIGRAVLAHHELEKDLLRGLPRRTRWIYSLKPELMAGITSSLGHSTGERIYQAMIQGRLPKKRVRDLFFHSFSGSPPAQETYLNLVKELRKMHLTRGTRGSYS